MTKKLHNSELDGATPVETPQDVEQVVVAETAAPRRGREARLEASTTATSGSTMPDYAAFGIEEAKVAEIEKLRLRFNELGRRSTEQVFECGEVVAKLQELAPDQESFAKLAKGVLGLSRRGAENYASVFRNLGRYRDRLVRTAMVASALYDLAAAEPDRVEEVLAAREAGQMLSGKQIREMLGKTGASSVSADQGGAAGLRARIAEKTAVGVSALMDNAVALLEAVLVSLVPYREGKRIVVKDVQRPLIYPTRLVREQLEWLTWVAVPAGPGFAEGAIHHFPVVKGDRWAELHATLWKLGDFEGWPAAKHVGPWLADVVVPQLEWLVGERAKKAYAVIEKMAAAAEAEREKAAREKERAKAEAKKARQKAKLEAEKAARRAAREAKALAKRASPGDEAEAAEHDAPVPTSAA